APGLHRPVMRMRTRPIAPVERFFIEFGRAGAQVFRRHVGLVDLTRGIEPEGVPADRTMMVAAEQPSGLDDGVGYRSAGLVEHQAFDRAEPCAVAAVDAHVLDAVTGHQGMRHGVLPVFPLFGRHPSIASPTWAASPAKNRPSYDPARFSSDAAIRSRFAFIRRVSATCCS